MWAARLASETIASAYIIWAITVPQQEAEPGNWEAEELALCIRHAAIEASVVVSAWQDCDLMSMF